MVKRDMATPNVNIPPGWRIRMLTVKNRRAQGMTPKPTTPAPAALDPQVQMSSGGASELHKRQDSTSLKQGQKKRRKTKASSANTTATSPVSLASDVGHVGTQAASESREKARAHGKKLFNSMIARTKHVDNPPPWDVGTEEDFCTKRPSQGSQAICPT
jgi:hypothetical protein